METESRFELTYLNLSADISTPETALESLWKQLIIRP